MQVIDLYRYEGTADGAKSINITLTKIAGAVFTPMSRLIADEGKIIINQDGQTATVVDVEINEVENWNEIDIPVEGEVNE